MMGFAARLKRRRVTLGVGLTLLVIALFLAYTPGWRFADSIREAAFDYAERLMPRRATSLDVIVIDIDRAALSRFGPWPWSRATHARLLEAIGEAKPRVVAYDMLLTAGLSSEAAEIQRLAQAIAATPTVLGMVLDPTAPDDPPAPAALLVSGELSIGKAMEESGISAPPKLLRDSAAGLGVISLGSAESALVRGVPLFAVGGERIYAGLALEAVRVAQAASSFIVLTEPRVIKVGDFTLPYDESASLRLRLAAESSRQLRTISARDFIDKRPGLPSITGRFVVVGSSAPELGGLRSTPADSFVSSADIHATAIEQILLQTIPRRPTHALAIEIAALIGIGLALLVAVLWLPPLIAGTLAILFALFWLIATGALFAANLLVDPLTPVIGGLLVFQGAALAAFTEQRRQRAEIERRFSQHLAPEIVRRIAENPDLVRLEGEERIVTALFTDIEGFTALGERANPRDLVKLLDTYVERICSVIVEYGGTVDKIVGDAVHAFFNAPVDLPDHARKAVTCAMAILVESEKLREEPLAKSLQLGRTRIGIETGPAIVGDVGGGRRFDYTAHGPAVNTAAKLEAANKRFGSSIAVGPTARGLVAGMPFRPLGLVYPSESSEAILASEPWPAALAEDIAMYQQAYNAVTKDRATAARLFEALAQRFPNDAVIEMWRERLSVQESAPDVS